MEFKEKVLIIEYGSVSKCTLPVLFKHLKVPYSKVIIIDFIETDQSLKHWTDKGVTFCREEIFVGTWSIEGLREEAISPAEKG